MHASVMERIFFLLYLFKGNTVGVERFIVQYFTFCVPTNEKQVSPICVLTTLITSHTSSHDTDEKNQKMWAMIVITLQVQTFLQLLILITFPPTRVCMYVISVQSNSTNAKNEHVNECTL